MGKRNAGRPGRLRRTTETPRFTFEERSAMDLAIKACMDVALELGTDSQVFNPAYLKAAGTLSEMFAACDEYHEAKAGAR